MASSITYAILSALGCCNSSDRYQIVNTQWAQAQKEEMESRGTASYREIQTYENLSSERLISNRIFCLDLSGCGTSQSTQLCVGERVEAFLENHRDLLVQIREIKGCENLTKKEFKLVINHVPNLKSLDIKDCHQLKSTVV
jgi:hypothetical protein